MTSFMLDSFCTSAKKAESLSEDAVNVSTDEEDATKCCYQVDYQGQKCLSPVYFRFFLLAPV